MTHRAAVAFACLVLAGCGQAPQSSGSGQPNLTADAMRTATPAPQFAARAAMFENYQIQAAQIAAERAQSPAAKAFAAASLAEHQATLQQLNGAAQAAGMPALSGTLDENYNAYLDMLRHANTQNFDTTYASQQALSYMSASGLYDSFTSTAPDSPLKQWAQTQSQQVHDGVNAGRQLSQAIQNGN